MMDFGIKGEEPYDVDGSVTDPWRRTRTLLPKRCAESNDLIGVFSIGYVSGETWISEKTYTWKKLTGNI